MLAICASWGGGRSQQFGDLDVDAGWVGVALGADQADDLAVVVPEACVGDGVADAANEFVEVWYDRGPCRGRGADGPGVTACAVVAHGAGQVEAQPEFDSCGQLRF